MIREFCSFTEAEYNRIAEVAEEYGYTKSKLIEYATTVFIDMPRTNMPNAKEIRHVIDEFLKRDDLTTFICSTPFADSWASMTTDAKRTAASQMTACCKKGLIEKVDPDDTSHRASLYRKVTS